MHSGGGGDAIGNALAGGAMETCAESFTTAENETTVQGEKFTVFQFGHERPMIERIILAQRKLQGGIARTGCIRTTGLLGHEWGQFGGEQVCMQRTLENRSEGVSPFTTVGRNVFAECLKRLGMSDFMQECDQELVTIS